MVELLGDLKPIEEKEPSNDRVSNFELMTKTVFNFLRKIDKMAREDQESMDHPEKFGLKVR